MEQGRDPSGTHNRTSLSRCRQLSRDCFFQCTVAIARRFGERSGTAGKRTSKTGVPISVRCPLAEIVEQYDEEFQKTCSPCI